MSPAGQIIEFYRRSQALRDRVPAGFEDWARARLLPLLDRTGGVAALEARLWGGFSRPALAGLEALLADPATPPRAAGAAALVAGPVARRRGRDGDRPRSRPRWPATGTPPSPAIAGRR